MEPTIPLCPYFRLCGGCDTQHIPYELQLNNKKQFVASQLKSARIQSPEPIVSSGKPYNYRNRMDFVFFSGGIGLRKKDQSSVIVPIKRCEISNEKINTLLNEVWDWYDHNRDILESFDFNREKGTMKYCVIRCSEFSEDSSISFVVNSDSQRLTEHVESIKQFSKTTSAAHVVISKVDSKNPESVSQDFFAVRGTGVLQEKFCGKILSYHSQGFFQNNSAMAQEMVNHSKNILSGYKRDNSVVLDIYGGIGTFGIPVAELFGKCIIIDSFPPSMESAKDNIKKNSISNTEVLCIDAAQIRKLDINLFRGKKIFAITDPPRTGMDKKTIQYLLEAKPQCILYVSCNPRQMAKELIPFMRLYSLASVALFDMFPQTNHIEVIAELKLKV